MKRFERRRVLNPRHQGFVLSPKHRLSLADSFKNLALVAPTGSGKTTRYVIPNVLAAEGSVLITDPSGEIFAQTSGHLRERGFRIQVLEPADLSHSLRFNPLHYWRSPQELRQLASILAFSGSNGRSDPFWTVSAVNVLYLLLSALVNVPDRRYVNLANLRWLLNHFGQADAGLRAFICRYLEHQDPQVFSEYLAFCATEPKVQASIIASARAALELWSDPEVCRFTADNTVDLEPLRHQQTAIFLIVPEHQVAYFSTLMNLFYSASFAHCLRDGRGSDLLPVFFFLDEFGNLGKVQDFASIITTLRKRHCSVSIILQALSQLESVYGQEEARTIFSGGCANKLFYSGLDLETAHYVERMLGQNTEYDTTFGGIDDRARTIGVPLMSADQVRMLRADEGILISGRQRPTKFAMPPCFRVERQKRQTMKSPVAFDSGSADSVVSFLEL